MTPRRGKFRQAAAVCYRPTAVGPLFLLVRTYDGKWTFPKGQIDEGMTESEAARNEAYEEAGVSGRIESEPFATFLYAKGNGEDPETLEVEIGAYLLAVREQRPPLEDYRHPEWFNAEEARAALRERRIEKYARELARVVDAAVARLMPA